MLAGLDHHPLEREGDEEELGATFWVHTAQEIPHLAAIAASEVAAALWPLAALSLVCRSVAAAGRLQLRAQRRRRLVAWAALWLNQGWPLKVAKASGYHCAGTAAVVR